MSRAERDLLSERLLRTALAELNYQQVRPLIFKSQSGTDEVEHFLYCSTYGNPREFFRADFGMRNPEIEAFSVRCVKVYGGAVYRLVKHDEEVDCKMRFSFGRTAGWEPNWSLSVRESGMEGLLARIRFDISAELLPIVKGITRLDELRQLLASDTEVCPWLLTNGAIRAAQIVGTALRAGTSDERVHAMLSPYLRWIEASLVGAMNPADYINAVIRDFMADESGGATGE